MTLPPMGSFDVLEMKRPISCIATVVAACLVMGAAQPVGAGEHSAQMAVGATVLASTRIDAESSPQQLEVSAADVARGYVEVLGATQLVITNTDRRGYLLSVWPKIQVFSSVAVGDGDGRAELTADGGEIFERRWGRRVALALDFRFMLAPGVKPGIYPWPVWFQVSSLSF
ncbi:MAG: hypothetical protein ABL907_06445 [Hyphomicrobium sp.]